MSIMEECILTLGKLVSAVFHLCYDAPLSMSAVLALAILILEFLSTSDKQASKHHSDKGLGSAQGREMASPVSVEPSGNVNVEESFRRLGAPETTHEEGCMIPSHGLILGNSPEASPFRNENGHGKFLVMHRATHDRQLDKSGDYQYGSYFHGKKRLWEARVQFNFTSPPNVKDVYFGVELGEYVPMNAATKAMMATMVRTLKNVVGNQIHHSAGDNPENASGELERPVFVMPMFAFDQYIITPENETPPDLGDEIIPELGSKRVGRVREFKQELNDLELKVGPTYTFCFWGISQWLDKLNWQVKMPFFSPFDLNKFCGNPPVQVVIYTLREDEDHRHLQRRKDYFLNVAFWSSAKRPNVAKLSELLGPELLVREDDVMPGARAGTKGVSARSDAYQGSGGLFACCVAR